MIRVVASIDRGIGAMQAATHSRRAVIGGALASGASVCLPRRASADVRLVMNDASRLNPTPVIKHVIRNEEPEEQLIAAIRAELKEAAAANRPVAVGAARHSMGGQSLPRDGTAITLDGRRIKPDKAAGIYRVEAGTRWADVIAALDPIGFSPLVMQSNNDFGVASTFCVNAHGWPVPHGPFGSTVKSLRMILADGSLVTCSRTENPDLFAHAMGGYGLFGIILTLDVEMTPNLLLVPTFSRMPAEQFGRRFVDTISGDATVKMAYGRLSLTRRHFFEEALLVAYRPHPAPPASLPAARHGTAMTPIINDVYRAQIGYELLKSLRWDIETRVAPALMADSVTRNTLLDEPVSNLANNDPRRTDILHEYFVPPDRFADFLQVCRDVIPKAAAEFINVTLRYIDTDSTARLAYAPSPRISAVMSFSQEMTVAGEIDMMTTTERLIDGILAIGGTFYLPYRLHARRDQVEQGYPAAAAFVARKRQYDPGLLFRNAMWTAYFA
jgi:FAD/FMN-containing dehydrogenase